MVAVSDFSGLASSAWALASAPAMAPIDSLDRCMGCLLAQDIEAHRPGLRPFGPNPMTDGLLGVFRHEAFELGFGALVLEKGRPGPTEHPGHLSPGVGRAHIDDPNGRDAGPGRLDPEQARRLAALHTAPELLLGGQKQVLVERISHNGDLDPFAAPGDDRERR